MSIRAAFKNRFSDDLDPAAVALRAEVRTLWAEMGHPTDGSKSTSGYDYIVMELGDTVDLYKDKGRGAVELTDIALMVVTSTVARAERLVELTRACYEAVNQHGGTCKLTINKRCFMHLNYVSDTIGADKRFPRKTVGVVEYELTAYRGKDKVACSSSSSSTSSSSTSSSSGT